MQGAESCVLAGFVLFSPVPCLVLVLWEGLQEAEGGTGGGSPVGKSPAGFGDTFPLTVGQFGFHFTHCGDQVPVPAHWGHPASLFPKSQFCDGNKKDGNGKSKK